MKMQSTVVSFFSLDVFSFSLAFFFSRLIPASLFLLPLYPYPSISLSPYPSISFYKEALGGDWQENRLEQLP
jgi:hypothetical protein